MATTIQISEGLQEALAKKKLYEKETYEEIIWDLIEDSMELSEETKKNIEKYEDDVRKGKAKFITLEEVKKKLAKKRLKLDV